MAVQTITKSVGTSSRNYSTLQAWEDDAPVDLTTAEKSAAGTFVGTFTHGEALSFVGSGATGKFLATDGATYVMYGVVSGNPAASDVVTGGSSGAVCTLSSSTPTDVGVIWRGEVYNDAEYISTNGNGVVNISGETVSATCYVELTAAVGQSFIDQAGIRTNPLKYDQTKGVGIRNTGNYSRNAVYVQTTFFTRVSRLQLKGGAAIRSDVKQTIFKDCLMHSLVSAPGLSSGDGSSNLQSFYYSDLFIADYTGSTGVAPGRTMTLQGCAVVRPSNRTAGGAAISFAYTNSGQLPLVISTAFFGFTSMTSGASPTFSSSCSNNATDLASGLPGTANQHSVTYTSSTPFTNASTASAPDFSVIAGTALSANGFRDATNAPNDITGFARSATPTIGVWELGVSSGPFPFYFDEISGGLSSLGMGSL